MQKKKKHLFYSGEFWLEKYKRSCSSKCMAEWRGNVHLLLARTSTGQLALLVQEVQHAAQDGQEEKADDDDHDHHAAVIDWRNREQQHDCTRCQYSTAMSTSHNNSKPRFFLFYFFFMNWKSMNNWLYYKSTMRYRMITIFNISHKLNNMVPEGVKGNIWNI